MLFELPDFDEEPRYDVVSEDQFLADCRRVADGHPHLNEILLWFQWLLERMPVNPNSHQCEEPYEEYFEMSSGDIPHLQGPTVIIIYTIEDYTVTLWGLNIVKGD